MKHKLWVASLTVLSACTLMACSHTTKKDTVASSTKESSSKVEKKTGSSSSKDTASSKKNTSSQETKRIGNADYGYIDIQVNGSSSLTLVELRLSNIQMAVPIT